MCGIFFYKNKGINTIEQDKNGIKCKHRGPDNTKKMSIISDNNYYYFMFHRLSINGLDSISNQPINIDNKTLICNGEIYNHIELAKKYNINLITNSDCEIIIHLYNQLSHHELLNQLDGVFSFVLYDSIDKKILIGHDPYGIRSLYWFHNDTEFGFSSEMKCLYDINKNIEFYKPGSFSLYDVSTNIMETIKYYNLVYPKITDTENNIILNIKNLLTKAVNKRIICDRPIGCLLSGGLDSSIITSIASKKIKNLKTFSIGMNGSPDLYNAEIVSKYLNTDHTIVLVSQTDMLDAIDRTIKQIESFDITTIRASVPMLLVSEYIRDHTDIRVLLSGEGADEASGSYLYFHNAPDPKSFQDECVRLLNDVHMFDVLRGDKTTAGAGLEIRVPFFDKEFMEYYMSIDPSLKMPRNGMEKYLLRKAFDKELPKDILWRRKDGFSDGVSSFERPWYDIIDEYADKTYNMTESELYKMIYDKYYKGVYNIPYMWMPKWSNSNDPSNRLIL
jgi:asparagine synthase (glutamine-hydrolysing)